MACMTRSEDNTGNTEKQPGKVAAPTKKEAAPAASPAGESAEKEERRQLRSSGRSSESGKNVTSTPKT